MLALGCCLVAEQLLVLRISTDTASALLQQSASPSQSDPGFIGRAEASTRSVPRPSGLSAAPAPAPLAQLACLSAPAQSVESFAAPHARRSPLNRRI
jgi:hypothetical protein